MRLINTLRYAGRMLRSRLRGEPSLLLAFIYPTHRCNLRCTYCSSPYLKTPELTTEQWLTAVDELADLGCRRVTILGGEPLVRWDVPEIIERVRERGMACTMTSNGVLVKRRIDDLRLLNTLTLSLDAVGSANDEVRGEGVFDAVKDAIAAARGVGISVKINAVLSAKTATLLDELLTFIEQHDLLLTVNIMRSGAPDLWHNAASIKAEDDEIRSTLDRLAGFARTNPRLLFSETTYRFGARWDDYSRDRYEADELAPDDPLLLDGPRCQAGRYYLTINPDGTTYPCVMTVGRILGGNVAIDGVEAAWRRLHGHRCVTCYSPCLVEQNYLFSLKPRVVGGFVARHMWRFF
ncbi:MAG: radical SAM protein [bacterium]|nr:radical SAM protein [bacterium]